MSHCYTFVRSNACCIITNRNQNNRNSAKIEVDKLRLELEDATERAKTTEVYAEVTEGSDGNGADGGATVSTGIIADREDTTG